MEDKEKYIENYQNSKSFVELEEGRTKNHFGIKIDKMRENDYSFGACITIDGFYGECYLYINIIKWSISIGWLMK